MNMGTREEGALLLFNFWGEIVASFTDSQTETNTHMWPFLLSGKIKLYT